MKAALVILSIWQNFPDGSQMIKYQSDPMPESQCLPLQAIVWAVPYDSVGVDARGQIPATDAACIPIIQ